jgi:Tfp pilus assembly protein PilZ
MERFSSCRLRVELEEDETWIECTGRVVWVVPKRDVKAKEPLFDTGIEFVDLDLSATERIQKYLKLHTPQPEKK